MVPETSPAVRRVTFVLLALSAGAVEVAAADTRPVVQSLGVALGWVAGAAVLARLVPLPADPRRKPPKWVLGGLTAFAVVPFALEPLVRAWTGRGCPLELQMVAALRNVGLGLAACAGWLLCLRLACVVSLFLTLFSAAMTNHPAVLVILGLYTAAGSVWLMLAYWSGLRGVLMAPAHAAEVEVQARKERLPWASLFVVVALVGVVLGLIAVGPTRAARTLGEWAPTSGGTGDTDPFARYGVGDGPEETAGDDAKAAGMVETDKMIEDNKNSLTDAVSDMYGPPHKPPEDQERMVAAGLVDVIQNHGKLPDNRRPSRDFDTGRKGPKSDRKPGSQAARGLFEVEGRTPLHIRFAVYESYDAAAHRWADGRQPSSKLLEGEGDCWMRLGHLRDSADWYRGHERHRLKIADMKNNLLPTPTLLTRFRINKVDKPDYYEWDYDGVLALAGRNKTPPGVVVTTDCRTLDPSRLPETAFGRTGTAGGGPPVLGEVPDALRPEIERTARAWAGDRPRGWPQVEAVLTKLRAEYEHDRDAASPPGHPAPVLWFLTESRRGPDYLFATAAALLLRALDYPARVCLGYYAAPAAYDPETAHTPVRTTDLHFWPEVLLRDGHWLVLEPTPGYDVLEPNLPLDERIAEAATAAARWAAGHALPLGFGLVAVAAAGVRRRELRDAAAVRWWRWFPARAWPERVRRAVRLLERRSRWAGKPRAAGQTVRGVAPRGRLGHRRRTLPARERGGVGRVRAGRAPAVAGGRTRRAVPPRTRRLDAAPVAERTARRERRQRVKHRANTGRRHAMITGIFWGVVLRTGQIAIEASTTLLVGLLVAGVMRRMLGAEGTRRLFGGKGWNGLLRAWGVGMLLPVCSLGVIPIAREMRRAGVPSGTILAFVLAAPHINPLSLLYGLTLSEPVVIVCFAAGSLVIALGAGAVWDRYFAPSETDDLPPGEEPTPAPGPKRLAAVVVTAAREAVNPTMGYVLLGLVVTGLISGLIPHGALGTSMRHDDPTSPTLMTAVALPLYCGPLQGMMRLGLMFEHGNSVGAAFVLFELGIGVNLGLMVWLAVLFGARRVVAWFALVAAVTLALGYAAEHPLYFAKAEDGHTHAFDDWTNPFTGSGSAGFVAAKFGEKVGVLEAVALGGLALLALLGGGLAALDRGGRADRWLTAAPPPPGRPTAVWNRAIPGPVLGGIALLGLVAFSVAALYVYYPPPAAAFEEIVQARTEAITAVRSGKREEAVRQIQHWDLLTRKLQVGDLIRTGRMNRDAGAAAEDLRERLEELRDAMLADDAEAAKALLPKVEAAYRACRDAYFKPPG